jgi:hypothetical protein
MSMLNFQNVQFHAKVVVSIYTLAVLVIIFPDFIFLKIITGLLWILTIIILVYGFYIDWKRIEKVGHSEVLYKKMIKIMYLSLFILSINFILLEAFPKDWIKKLLPFQYLVMVYIFGIMLITGISEKYFGKMYYDLSFLKKNRKK